MFYTSKSAEEGVLDAPKGKDGSGSRSFESRNGWKEVPHICTHISISAPNVCWFIFLMKSKKTKKNPLWFEADDSINPKCVVCFRRAFRAPQNPERSSAPFYSHCKILVDWLGMSGAWLPPCRASLCRLPTVSVPLALFNLDNTSGFKIVHLTLSRHRHWWGRSSVPDE